MSACFNWADRREAAGVLDWNLLRDHTLVKWSWMGILVDLCVHISTGGPLYRVGEAYCQGRLLRCGETKTQLPRRILNRRWDMSFRIGSDMAEDSDTIRRKR